MSPARVAVVWNPSKTDGDELRAAFADAAQQLGPESDASALEPMWLETTVDDPGRGAAERAIEAGCGLVVAAGGDGTVRAVAEGVAGTEAELGIVPLGTGNLLARNLDVPLGDPAAAFARALGGEARAIDMGWVDTEGDDGDRTHGFAVMVGFGIDAQMLAETDDELKERAGWLAYVEAMGRALSASEVVDFELALDDADARPASGHTLLIGNCGTIQGGVTLLSDADPADGRLDLLLVSAEGVGEWLGTLKTMVWDNGVKRFFAGSETAESGDGAEHLSASRVRVELPAPHAFEVDGDEVGAVRAFTARLDAGALRVR